MGLTKTVAREFAGRNILCNAVAPGFVASDMTAALDPKYEAQIFKTIPLGAPCQAHQQQKQIRAVDLKSAYLKGRWSALRATSLCACHEQVQLMARLCQSGAVANLLMS